LFRGDEETLPPPESLYNPGLEMTAKFIPGVETASRNQQNKTIVPIIGVFSFADLKVWKITLQLSRINSV